MTNTIRWPWLSSSAHSALSEARILQRLKSLSSVLFNHFRSKPPAWLSFSAMTASKRGANYTAHFASVKRLFLPLFQPLKLTSATSREGALYNPANPGQVFIFQSLRPPLPAAFAVKEVRIIRAHKNASTDLFEQYKITIRHAHHAQL